MSDIYSYVVVCDEVEVRMSMWYSEGRPAGYTDDLGIIADRNQWIREELPGWYALLPRDDADDIISWCEQNFSGPWDLRDQRIYMVDHDDVTLFKMRWL